MDLKSPKRTSVEKAFRNSVKKNDKNKKLFEE